MWELVLGLWGTWDSTRKGSFTLLCLGTGLKAATGNSGIGVILCKLVMKLGYFGSGINVSKGPDKW